MQLLYDIDYIIMQYYGNYDNRYIKCFDTNIKNKSNLHNFLQLALKIPRLMMHIFYLISLNTSKQWIICSIH